MTHADADRCYSRCCSLYQRVVRSRCRPLSRTTAATLSLVFVVRCSCRLRPLCSIVANPRSRFYSCHYYSPAAAAAAVALRAPLTDRHQTISIAVGVAFGNVHSSIAPQIGAVHAGPPSASPTALPLSSRSRRVGPLAAIGIGCRPEQRRHRPIADTDTHAPRMSARTSTDTQTCMHSKERTDQHRSRHACTDPDTHAERGTHGLAQIHADTDTQTLRHSDTRTHSLTSHAHKHARVGRPGGRPAGRLAARATDVPPAAPTQLHFSPLICARTARTGHKDALIATRSARR